jgi:hypothetical protein
VSDDPASDAETEGLMAEGCSRCGYRRADHSIPCRSCWEGRADAELALHLGDAARHQERDALYLLARIDDPSAAPVLRRLASDGDPGIRSAAISSLAWSGAPEDVGVASSALADSDAQVRSVARSALAEIGGSLAADCLYASGDRLEPDERAEVQAALAWLGDDRDLAATRALAAAHLPHCDHRGYGHERGSWLAVPALLRIGTDADAVRLVDATVELIAAVEVTDPRKERWGAMRGPFEVANHLMWHLRRLRRDTAAAGLISRLAERDLSFGLDEVRLSAGRGVDCEPLLPRTVPRLGLREELSRDRLTASGNPPAKFGGQPDWVEAPTWPLSPDGAPMVFLTQLPVIGAARTAYVFFSADAHDSWSPLSAGNAVAVQPGAPPHTATTASATGPGLFEQVHEPHRYRQVGKSRRYERFIQLAAGADPPDWNWPELPAGGWPALAHEDTNKVGGTPHFLQGPDQPPGDGWRFAFQFNAGWSGHEFGDGAECYGFFNEDGRGGFLWQCH